MSRTHKDKPSKLRYEPYYKDRVCVYTDANYIDEYGHERNYRIPTYISTPTTKTKKRKEVDTEEHWMSTPGWWINMMMTRPQRNAGKAWERAVVKTPIAGETLYGVVKARWLDSQTEEALELLDVPNSSRKPHIYYW